MSNQDAALLLLTSQHTTDLSRQAMAEEMARLELENAKLRAEQRAAKPKKEKGSKARPIHGTQPMKGVLRNPTPESSTTFLKAARAARNREEAIKAIDAFVGYDLPGDFGAQDTRARMLATTCLRPVSTSGLTREEQTAANNSAKGFIAGLPNHQAKALANLRAQAEQIAIAIIQFQKDGNDAAVTLERERINHVYVQIKALGFTR